MRKLLLLIVIGMIMFSIQAAELYKPTESGTFAVFVTSKGNIVVKLNEIDTPKTAANFVGLAEGTKEWTDPKTNKPVKRPFYNGLIFHRVIKDFMIQGGDPLGTGMGGPGFQFEDETYKGSEALKGEIKDESVALEVWNQIIAPYMQNLNGTPPNAEIKALVDDVVAKQSGAPIIGKTIEYFQQATAITTPLVKRIVINPVAYGTLCMANSGPNTNGSQFFIVTKKDGCSWLDGLHTVFGKVVQGMEVAQAIESVKTGEQDAPVEKVIIKEIKIIRKK